MIRLMERYPFIITLGAALIGWVAGETISNDTSLHDYVLIHAWMHTAGPIAGAAVVLGLGTWLQKRSTKAV